MGVISDKRMCGSILQSKIEYEHECYLYKEGYLRTHTTECKPAERGRKDFERTGMNR